MDAQLARTAISLVDLTDLTHDCTPADVDALCDRARRYGTAAVCVWPDFVGQSTELLAGSPVVVATVVNFPSGDERPFAVGVMTDRVLADGATEVDVVLPFRWFVSGDVERCRRVLDSVRKLTAGSALMKVILETGELPDLATVDQAARFAIERGADFVKTSTGKTPVSATLDAAATILRVIADTDRPVGIKPSGGISTAADAAAYITAAEQIMGEGWVTPATFRFGASGLLNALIGVAGLEPAPAGAGRADSEY